MIDRDNVDVLNNSSFGGIGLRDQYTLEAQVSRCGSHCKNTFYRSGVAIQR